MGFGRERFFYSDRQCYCRNGHLDAYRLYHWALRRSGRARSLSGLGNHSLLCAAGYLVYSTGSLFTKRVEKETALTAVIGYDQPLVPEFF